MKKKKKKKTANTFVGLNKEKNVPNVREKNKVHFGWSYERFDYFLIKTEFLPKIIYRILHWNYIQNIVLKLYTEYCIAGQI